jgi:hypothetical protein
MTDRPDVKVRKRTIATGTGHSLKRYAVIQNGRTNALFAKRKEAEHFMRHIIWSWEEQE